MASIYDGNGYHMAQGLQGSDACDEAIITAKRIAARREETVYLEDDDGYWIVEADGSVEATTAKAIGLDGDTD